MRFSLSLSALLETAEGDADQAVHHLELFDEIRRDHALAVSTWGYHCREQCILGIIGGVSIERTAWWNLNVQTGTLTRLIFIFCNIIKSHERRNTECRQSPFA